MVTDEKDSSEGTDSNESDRQATANKLKDLFAPQEDNAGFSLLGHLDLDLELDEGLSFPIITTEEPQAPEGTSSIIIPTNASGQSGSTGAVTSIHFDPKKPLFFPLPSSSSLGPVNKGRQKDLFDVAKEKGWNWRDPSVGFYRTETEDEIRKRWEESKGELTREWKRRWKEARKISRRKRGGVREEES